MVGGAQVLLRRLPLLGQVGYVAYGPLVASGAPRRRTVAALAQALETLARRRLRALFVQPMDGEDIVSSLRAQGFRPSQAGIAPAHTVRIDLEASEDALHAGLSKRVRRWTGKWHKAGVQVRRGRAKDVAVLTDLIAHSAEHQGYSGLSSEYVRTLYRHLADEGRVEIFVAEIDGKPAAAELFTACGGVLRSRLTGLDRSGSASRLSVTSALDWEALRWAKREGFAEFDLGGLSHSAATMVRAEGFSPQGISGPDRFKLAFGGRLHTYPPAVELIPSVMLRRSYDLLSSAAFGRAALGRAREWMRAGPRALAAGTRRQRPLCRPGWLTYTARRRESEVKPLMPGGIRQLNRLWWSWRTARQTHRSAGSDEECVRATEHAVRVWEECWSLIPWATSSPPRPAALASATSTPSATSPPSTSKTNWRNGATEAEAV
jgi:hypothetical protein